MNIFKNKQNNFFKNNINYFNNFKSNQDQFVYYPPTTEEWSNNIYTYNKSYLKLLVNIDIIINNLLKSYFNMIEEKTKIFFKRKRIRNIRFSSDILYVSKAKIKHTNNKITIILYVYNKQKDIIQRNIKNIVRYMYNIPGLIKLRVLNRIPKKSILFHTWKKSFKKTILKEIFEIKIKRIFFIKILKLDKFLLKIFFKNFLFKFVFLFLYKKYFIKNKLFFKERLLLSLIFANKNLYWKIFNHITLGKKLALIEEKFFSVARKLNFNKCKFTNLFLVLQGFGLISLMNKIYNKKVKLKIVELKSLHLSSDILSYAISIKLKNRKNRALGILIKAVRKIKLPSLYLLLTSDNNNIINNKKILNYIQQKIISGVRFEASGRLTKRLTASRSIFKVRYSGSLKNIRSSYNKLSSATLRGHIKSNLQYTVINSKTRNGSFGLKGWISSH